MQLPHKSKKQTSDIRLPGKRAVIITTSQSTLDEVNEFREVVKIGKATGVYASEFTEAYYTFLDAGMNVELASIEGGKIPIEALSLLPAVRTEEDMRFLKDDKLKHKVEHSLSVEDVNMDDFDIIFLSGGWGAAYDLAQSEVLAKKISKAYENKQVLGAVCHGPLGFIGAQKPDGSPLVEGVKMTGVTNRQIKQLMVGKTPKHPETELRKAGADYQFKSGLIDMFQNLVVVDQEHRIVTGQNQKGGREAALEAMKLLSHE